MATKKRKRFAEGGISEESDKSAGLESSKGEKVGFFDRLRMGNIDDPSSEAYRRFGAGRGRAERVPVEDMAATPVSRAAAKEEPMDEMEAADRRYRESPIEVPAGPRAASSTGGGRATAEKKASPKMQEQTYTRKGGASAEERASYEPPVSKKYPENRGSIQDSMVKERSRQIREGAEGIERVTPETALLPGGGLKGLHGLAKSLATPKMATYTQQALAAPTKRLAYDKAGALARSRAERAAAREEEMLAENAARYGLNPKSPGYEAAAGAVRKELGGKDFSFKRGGAVKKSTKSMKPAKKMPMKDMSSPVSKRADGIAIRGKTRGKIY